MSYDKLDAEKNRAMATLRTTIEERDKEREAQRKREEENKEVEKAIRDLCQAIISKRDMNSGTDKSLLLKTGATSYDKLPTRKLIEEARRARKEYDESRTNLMKELHKANSELKLEGNNLREHQKINEEALKRTAEEIHKLKKDLIDKGKNPSVKPKVKTEIDNIKQTEREKRHTLAMINEAEKIAEKTQNKTLKDITERLKKPKTGKVTATEKQMEITRISEELCQGGAAWEKAKVLFGIIGRTGLSLKKDIDEALKKQILKEKKSQEAAEKYASNTTLSLNKLVDLGLLTTGKFTLETTLVYYEMTSIGNAVFFKIEGKEAEPSHYSKVTAAHSSAKHGYGIVGIAETMRQYPDRFMNISEFNKDSGRNLTTHIEIDGKSVEKHIEPDIIFDEKFINDKGKTVIEERYIEYELVTQTKEEYFYKLEKYIMRGTKDIFFIFPNGTLQKNFQRIVRQYLEMKLAKGIDFSDINFYLYTTKQFNLMCEDKKDWKPTLILEENIEEEKDETFEDKTTARPKPTGRTKTTNEEKASSNLINNSSKAKVLESLNKVTKGSFTIQ